MIVAKSSFEYFVYFIFPLVMLGLGLFGNIMGSILLTVRKNLSQLGPVDTYRYMFLTDCACLVQTILDKYFLFGYSFGFSSLNDFTCKAYKYIAYLLASPSHLFLLYILVERFLAIKFPVESNRFRTRKCQLGYFIAITLINMVYFTPILVYYNVKTKVFNNNITINSCELVNDSNKIIHLLFLSKVFIPLVLILFFSLLLVYTIIKSKSRMSTFYTPRENEIFRKDVGLSFMSILMNFIILCFNLPFIIVYYNLISVPEYLYVFFYYIFYCIYTFKFYFFLLFNSLFRQEFFKFFLKEKESTVPTNNEEIEML